MLKVVYSNNMVQLAAQLAELQQRTPLPPLVAETVLVQSNELARWLSLFLAQQHGVASHIEFPYPSAYIWKLFGRVLPNVPQQSSFATDAMTWRIFELLPKCRQIESFSIVNNYLGEQDDPLKLYGLSHRIADSFDQYLMYRPDWLQAWESGETPHWQAYLWQRLTENEQDIPANHRANLLNQLRDNLTATDTRPVGLPERLAVFGISALPPVYLNLFELMARHCDITLYFLSPSEGYWGDLVDQKTQAKRLAQRDLFDAEQEQEDEYFNTGHPLLASMGKQGQAFFEQLQSCQHEAFEAYIEPQQSHLLGLLQFDIYSLQTPDLELDKTAVNNDDNSIMIHACHSAMREIEVLHDQLLALFEHDPELSPTDIVVMTPDIEIYAPWIDAVFGNIANKQHAIAYGIADCGVRYQSPVLNGFMALLSLPQSRFDVETVLALLECKAIQNRFSLDDQQLVVIRQWLSDTHTRWGLSAQHKAEFDLPETGSNTWRAGLDRLLLGFAMPMTHSSAAGQKSQLFEQQLAFDGISGDKAATMAQLCSFVDSLDNVRQKLSYARTAEQWQQQLNDVLDILFLPSPDSNDDTELNIVRQTLGKLVESTELADFEQKLSLALVKEWLNDHLDTSQTISRFMGHGVTFCGMVPMRSIPFKVVALIGMNDESYPRRQPTQGFDLLSHDFRLGDRSRRDDDRYLFLEALMSCQQYLYISYVGASIRDNAAIPPSVLVSDLRDVLNQSYCDEQGEDIWPQCLTQHPLQSFSQRYFDASNNKLFSFAQAQCPRVDKTESTTWFENALPQADDSWRQVTLNQLVQFYRHPARYLLRERLGMQLDVTEQQLDIREPFELDGLQAWQLRQQLLNTRLNDDLQTNMIDLVKASGVLPQGLMGEQLFEAEAEKVDSFADILLPQYPEALLPAISFELSLNEFELIGQIEPVSQQGIFHYRMAKTKGHDILTTWISHLVLNAVKPKGIALNSTLLTEDNDYQFAAVEDPKALLSQLLELYWQGIHQPISLLNNTSYAFAKTTLNKTKASADTAMLNAWQGGQYSAAEADDVYHQQLYANHSPLNDAFKDLALAVYEPIHTHLVEGEL